MKKVLITGINGQDGIILTKILKKKNYLVYGFVKKNTKKNKVKYFSTSNKKFNIIKKEIDKIKPDIIIHLGSKNPSYNKKFIKKDYKINLHFTKKIIDYVKNNNYIKLILISSSIIFKNSKKKINENSRIFVTNYYSKFRVESLRYLLLKKKKFKLNATVLILFNHDSKYRNKRFLIPRIIKAIKTNNTKFLRKIYAQNISGDFSHAEDICNGIYLLIKKNQNPDKLILCSGKRTHINKIIILLFKKFNKNIKLIKKHNKNNVIGTNKLAKKIINWSPKKNIIKAAKEIYANY